MSLIAQRGCNQGRDRQGLAKLVSSMTPSERLCMAARKADQRIEARIQAASPELKPEAIRSLRRDDLVERHGVLTKESIVESAETEQD